MKISNKNPIIERIKQLRKQHSGDRGKSKFARALGISPSTYSYYENNRVPPIEVLLKICEITGADIQLLFTGQSAKENFAFGSNDALLQKLDALLIENPDMTEPVLAFVELLCEKKGVEKKFSSKILTSKKQRPGWIPVLGRTAAGIVHFWDETTLPEPKQAITQLEQLVEKYTGKNIIDSVNGTVLIDLRARPLVEGAKKVSANLIQVAGLQTEQVAEFIQCEQIHSLFPDSFALRIDGDSMSPRINDGDIVILSPSVPAAQGQVSIVRLSDQIGVTCKLLRTTNGDVHLIPINEKYQTKVIDKKHLVWALAVLCHVRV